MPADTSPEILHSNASAAAACPSSGLSVPAPCSRTAAYDDRDIGDGGDIDAIADPHSTDGYMISDGGDIDALSADDHLAKLDVTDGGVI